MNTEDFVTYEQALTLKKLGFNCRCTHYYERNKLTSHYDIVSGDGGDEDYKISIEGMMSCVNENCPNIDVCDAPTLAQAQKWLRKEKGYSVEPVSGDTDERGWEYGLTNRNYEYPSFTFNNVTYSSYEEALSAGITECIKLLKKEN